MPWTSRADRGIVAVVTMATQPKSSNAAVQRELWGRHPRDWAEFQEGQLRSFYEAIVAGMAIGPETRLLDAGCGSGLFCRLAADAGAEVTASETRITL